MSKKIIIVGEGNYIKKHQHNYIHATGEFGKQNSFQFLSVQNGQYYDVLEELDKIISLNEGVVNVYIFMDYYTNHNFRRRFIRNLNRRKRALRDGLEGKAYFIDLIKGKTEPFVKKQEDDQKTSCRKNFYKKNHQRVA